MGLKGRENDVKVRRVNGVKVWRDLALKWRTWSERSPPPAWPWPAAGCMGEAAPGLAPACSSSSWVDLTRRALGHGLLFAAIGSEVFLSEFSFSTLDSTTFENSVKTARVKTASKQRVKTVR